MTVIELIDCLRRLPTALDVVVDTYRDIGLEVRGASVVDSGDGVQVVALSASDED